MLEPSSGGRCDIGEGSREMSQESRLSRVGKKKRESRHPPGSRNSRISSDWFTVA